MISNPYTPIAEGEQLRAAKYLLGWMIHQHGKVLPPDRVDAMEFARWMLLPENIVPQRYTMLWLSEPHLADLYKAIAQSKRPATAQDLWIACPGKNRMEHVRSLARLRSTYTHWVKCRNGAYWATIDQLSTHTVGTFCGWLGSLWKLVAPESPNPWWEARAACHQHRLLENHTRWGEPQIKASQMARAWISEPTMLAARDAWLLCGVALLGLRAQEIVSAKRSDLLKGKNGHLYLHVKSRPIGNHVIVGPAAASWLHRFEGSAHRDWGDRAKAFLDPNAPLWPSLARWGSFKSYLDPLRADSVQSILRAMSVDDEDRTWLTMLSLRSLLEGSFDRPRREVAELMGRARRKPTLSRQQADEVWLCAQSRCADELWLSEFGPS